MPLWDGSSRSSDASPSSVHMQGRCQHAPSCMCTDAGMGHIHGDLGPCTWNELPVLRVILKPFCSIRKQFLWS